MDNEQSSFLPNVIQTLGTEERSLRLLLSLFAGYPLAFIYRTVLHGMRPEIQHVFFIVSGLSISYFNFGGDTMHSLANTVAIWLLMKVLGATVTSVVIAFIFNTLYLGLGYYYSPDLEYVISWITPHCVLLLRLTGLMFDLYDGTKPRERLSAEQKEMALHKPPSLLELMGHVYYFGGFLVGPQFGMVRYRRFVQGKFSDVASGKPPRNVVPALTRLVLGVLYIAVFQILSLNFTNKYMLTSQFDDLGFLYKCFYIMVWGKLHICKYTGCWLIVEGSCILTGLTYNGKDINGNTLWDGCTNVKVVHLETAGSFREMIGGFNINTNNWMARYIYKRLKFLGSVQVSQMCTLLYLAIWHGVQSGYYVTFFLEFILLNMETQITTMLRYLPAVVKFCTLPVIAPLIWCCRKMLLQFSLSYVLVSFVHLEWQRYSVIYTSVFYVGHISFLVIGILCYATNIHLVPTANKSKDHKQKNSGGFNNGKKME